jgi:hypothetical protein
MSSLFSTGHRLTCHRPFRRLFAATTRRARSNCPEQSLAMAIAEPVAIAAT